MKITSEQTIEDLTAESYTDDYIEGSITQITNILNFQPKTKKANPSVGDRFEIDTDPRFLVSSQLELINKMESKESKIFFLECTSALSNTGNMPAIGFSIVSKRVHLV